MHGWPYSQFRVRRRFRLHSLYLPLPRTPFVQGSLAVLSASPIIAPMENLRSYEVLRVVVVSRQRCGHWAISAVLRRRPVGGFDPGPAQLNVAGAQVLLQRSDRLTAAPSPAYSGVLGSAAVASGRLTSSIFNVLAAGVLGNKNNLTDSSRDDNPQSKHSQDLFRSAPVNIECGTVSSAPDSSRATVTRSEPSVRTTVAHGHPQPPASTRTRSPGRIDRSERSTIDTALETEQPIKDHRVRLVRAEPRQNERIGFRVAQTARLGVCLRSNLAALGHRDR